MSEERSYKKPLIVGGLVAAAGAGWLALGLNGGKPKPRTVKEALVRFRDPSDTLRAAKFQVMGLLLRSEGRSANPSELVAHIAEENEADELARRRMLRTMTNLGKASLGEFAFANLAVDLDRTNGSGEVIELYKATPIAVDLFEAGELPEVSGS